MRLGEKAGLKASKPLRDIFGEALLNVARENPKVVVLDGDLGNSTKTELTRLEFPERSFNIGIAESNLVCIGAGMAGAGLIPWITSFSSFLLCNAYDQIRLAVAMSKINAKILGSHGGITLGKDGPTQMGIEDLALVGGLPTMVILVPCDPISMHALVRAATDYEGPVWLRSSRIAMPEIYSENAKFVIGKANTVREGDDLTIIGNGMMVAAALDAATVLEEEGIQARVLDMHSIRPMDVDAIVSAAKVTGAIVSAEEHLLHGGMGSNIARIVAENAPVPMEFVGLADTYVESGDPEELLVKYHLTSADILEKSRLVFSKKKEC
ncbi:MAG: transketolase family protein [Anaerolineaceae bacterium]|nr:transketolase family protein [Anaerolineaceae bacterium]